MEKNITVNHVEGKIIVAEKIAKKAQVFGSNEYRRLQEARKDYPSFTVELEVRKKSRKDNYKGLTYDFMRTYITKHDSSGNIMEDFKNLIGENGIAEELGVGSVSYGELKAWFLNTFPEIKTFYTTREKILGKEVA